MPESGGMTGRDRHFAMQFAYHCLFIINTGLRISEYITAQQSNLYPDRLTVHGKGKHGQLKTRTVPLNHRAKWTLKKLIQYKNKDELIFPYCNRRSWYNKYIRWFGRAGFKQIGPHVLRHTFGSWLAMSGVPLATISQVMGHSNIQTTIDHYIHLTPGHLQNATVNLRYHNQS
jgi:integrase